MPTTLRSRVSVLRGRRLRRMHVRRALCRGFGVFERRRVWLLLRLGSARLVLRLSGLQPLIDITSVKIHRFECLALQ